MPRMEVEIGEQKSVVFCAPSKGAACGGEWEIPATNYIGNNIPSSVGWRGAFCEIFPPVRAVATRPEHRRTAEMPIVSSKPAENKTEKHLVVLQCVFT